MEGISFVVFSVESENPGKTCRARATNLRTHFKKMREVGHAIKGMKLKKAQTYLNDVLEFKQAVPFKRFTGGCGRHAQAKNVHASGDQVGWPVKSTKFMLDLLQNLEANGEMKGLDVDLLVISHMKVDRARKMRRRTYRAHGRINAYLRSPCHIEIICTEKDPAGVKRARNKTVLVTRRQAAKNRLIRVGGGAE